MATVHMGSRNRQTSPHPARAKIVARAATARPPNLASEPDRRRSFRVDVPADALLWRRGHFAGRYQLEDLSIGGCRLSEGPARSPGELVEVLIRMPHHGALSLPATVVRRTTLGAGRNALGLSFAGPSANAEDWIHDVVLWAVQGALPGGPRTGLVLMEDRREAAQVVRALRQIGRPTIAAHTPLDAVQLLVEQGTQVDVVVLDDKLGSGHGTELAQFLAHNHPAVHRVMIGEPDHIRSLIDAHNCGVAEAILTLPVRTRELERMLRSLGCWLPIAPRGGVAKC